MFCHTRSGENEAPDCVSIWCSGEDALLEQPHRPGSPPLGHFGGLPACVYPSQDHTACLREWRPPSSCCFRACVVSQMMAPTSSKALGFQPGVPLGHSWTARSGFLVLPQDERSQWGDRVLGIQGNYTQNSPGMCCSHFASAQLCALENQFKPVCYWSLDPQ